MTSAPIASAPSATAATTSASAATAAAIATASGPATTATSASGTRSLYPVEVGLALFGFGIVTAAFEYDRTADRSERRASIARFAARRSMRLAGRLSDLGFASGAYAPTHFGPLLFQNGLARKANAI